MDANLVLPIIIVSVVCIFFITILVVGIVLIMKRSSSSKVIKDEVNLDLKRRIEVLEKEIKDIKTK